jgi:hypothetical protein
MRDVWLKAPQLPQRIVFASAAGTSQRAAMRRQYWSFGSAGFIGP